MNTGTVANLLNISVGTVRRWADTYRDFLFADATPPKGNVRVFWDRDVQVLLLIARLSSEGMDREGLEDCLRQIAEGGWQGLPEVPADWESPVRNIIVPTGLLERRKQEDMALARVYQDSEDNMRALELSKAAVQELLDKLGILQQILAEKEEEIAAKDDLIAQQRKRLQIALAALKLHAQQQAAHQEAILRQRRTAQVLFVLLPAITAAVSVLILY